MRKDLPFEFDITFATPVDVVSAFIELRSQLDNKEYKEYEKWAIAQGNISKWSFKSAIAKVEEILCNRLEREIFGAEDK